MIEASVTAARRAHVLERLGAGGVLVVAAAPELRVGPDGEVRYVPDADLYWLTGYEEPAAVLVISPLNEPGPFAMFVRPRDPEREQWTGVRGGVEAATGIFGADAAFPIDELRTRLPKLLGGATTVFARLRQGRDDVDELILGALATGRRRRPRRGRGPHTLTDPGVLLDDLRRVKDETEIERMREAARITAAAFRDAARAIQPGAGEWEVEAALDAGFRSRGAWGAAFPTIVAGGANATTLHYTSNGDRLQEGQLVLLDAGARHRMYCADISRTLPVSGRFNDKQRELYHIVRAAHDAAIAAVAPGATVDEVHRAALVVLVDGLCQLGFLEGTVGERIEDEEAWQVYYPHKTSHWLGLDVHDVGTYVEGGTSIRLEPGMVLTIEPGLYIPATVEKGPRALRGIGIRTEDDVLVTAAGHEVLTGELPADAEGIETLLFA